MEKQETAKARLFIDGFAPEYQGQAGMFLCTCGAAEMLINDRKYDIKEGMLHFISPLVTVYRLSQSSDFTGIYITDELEVFYTAIRSNIDAILQLKLRNVPCIRLDEEHIRYITECKKRIDNKQHILEQSSSEEEKKLIRHIVQLMKQEALLEIISLYFRMTVVAPQPIDKNEAVIYDFIYSLHANFKKERSVTFYANKARLSIGYFTSIIKQKTEHTPSEWIVSITIAHAKLQLAKTPKSIKEIASELNFPEQFTFRKYFKQHVGIPPKQYRIQTQKMKRKVENTSD